MKNALSLMQRRLPMVVVALLAGSALACSSSKTADQPVDDVAADTVGTDDTISNGDVTATDGGVDTSDITSKTDVASDAEPELTPECTKNTECNDSDPCTDNICAKGVCSNPYNAGPCDDGDPCTQNDYCKQGVCAGKGACTDTEDDTGPDTTNPGDTTGDTSTPTGCGDAEWQTTLNDAFVGKLGTCGQGCAQNLNAQCLSDCIATSGSLSTTCADCFGELGVCVGNKCLMDCIGGATAQGCKDCAAKNCGNALSTCVGHPVPNCAADGDCDDGSVCTTDTCANMFCTFTAKNCDDGNACTSDSCDTVKGCTSVALPTSVTCDDGNACTEGDNCGTGNCVGTTKICDDNNACTDDACDLGGACTTTNNAVSCDDGVTCTTGDACTGGACAGTKADANCDDGNPCTIDACDAKNGCSNVAAGAISCDDNNYCTVSDTCDGKTCSGSIGTPCTDNNVCTTDYCDPTVGNDAKAACSHDDTAANKCDDGNACTADSCDPTTGCVNNKLSGTSCNDLDPNTIDDTCSAGSCAGSVPECLDVTQCNDAKSCTTDSCDSVTHTCKHTINVNTCLIDGGCYTDAQTKSDNDCLACTTAKSSNTWSNANETLGCGTAGTCASGVCKDPWPPTAPLSNGKLCALPTCDTASKPAFNTTGNWIVTTKTLSTTCGTLIQLVEPRANVGYTKSGKAHPQNFVGGCDYASGGTTTQIGTIVSNVEASCSVSTDANFGVTYVESGIITYGVGKGTGTITATLFDIPDAAGEPNNSCEIVLQVSVQHVADCLADKDCDDTISCTTDLCASGICQHNLDASTCLIDGQCVADGAYQSATGNGSCRLCSGKFPSQYGWVILSSGEPCNTTLNGMQAYTCQTAGQCLVAP